MKEIYLVPYAHSAPTPELRTWLKGEFEKLRISHETKVAERLKKISPQKIFWEGSKNGKDISSSVKVSVLFGSRYGGPIGKTVCELIKSGTLVEGAENEKLYKLHYAVGSRNINYRLRLKEEMTKHYSLFNETNGLRSIKSGFTVIFKGVLSNLIGFFLDPVEKSLVILRDFYMGRSISRSSIEGVNVILCGARHNPLRFVYGKDIKKCFLMTDEEVKEMKRQLIELARKKSK